MSAHSAQGRPWRRMREQILNANRVCALQLDGCTRYATTVDHIIPVSRGGAQYDRNNCAPACSHCNNIKGNRTDLQPTVSRSREW